MRAFFLFLISLNFLCFAMNGQITGQGKPTHDQYDAISASSQGLKFEVIKPFRLIKVEAWSAGSGGILFIELQDSTTGIVLETARVEVPSKGTIKRPIGFDINLNWVIPPGEYRLIATSGPPLMYDYFPTTGGSYSYPIGGVGKIVSAWTPDADDDNNYFFFYNWTVEY